MQAHSSPDVRSTFGIFGLLIFLAALIVVAASYYPFKAEYHRWEPVSGTVDYVRTAGLERVPGASAQLSVAGRPYLVNGSSDVDIVQPGDAVTIRCRARWTYQDGTWRECQLVDLSIAPTS